MAAELLKGKVEIYRFNESQGNYTSCCVLVYKDNNVTVKGLAKKITRDDWKELNAYLLGVGVEIVHYERRKNGFVIYKEVKIQIN